MLSLTKFEPWVPLLAQTDTAWIFWQSLQLTVRIKKLAVEIHPFMLLDFFCSACRQNERKVNVYGQLKSSVLATVFLWPSETVHIYAYGDDLQIPLMPAYQRKKQRHSDKGFQPTWSPFLQWPCLLHIDHRHYIVNLFGHGTCNICEYLSVVLMQTSCHSIFKSDSVIKEEWGLHYRPFSENASHSPRTSLL